MLEYNNTSMSDKNATDAIYKTIFVSGLNYKTTEQQIKEFFEVCGTIQ